MKLKYYFIGLTFCCGLGLSSCNDSFLTEFQKTSCLMILSGKTAKMLPSL